MNVKNRVFTLVSIGALSLAVAIVGSYVYLTNPQVSADINESQNAGFYTAKKGWNYFTAGASYINEESRIISVNRSLISIADAKNRGIISEVSLVEDGKMVSRDVGFVSSGEDFAVLFNDISLSPEVYLGD